MTDAEKLRAIEFLLNDDDYRDFVRDCGADDMADTVLSIIQNKPDAFAKDFCKQ